MTDAAEFSICARPIHSTLAKNVKEACALVETGFEYVTGEYHDGGKIFGKHK